MRLLRQRIEQLESVQKGTDIDVQLQRLSAYGLRSLVVKYTTLSMAETLASDAKQNPKASFLSMASKTMRGYGPIRILNGSERTPLALPEKEYTQVLNRISKVNKSLRGDRTCSQFPPGRSSGGPVRSAAIICDFFGIPGHTSFRCFRGMSSQRAGSGRFSPYSRAPHGRASF